MAIHPTAIISRAAELDSTVEVGPHAIIEAGVRIGAGTRIGPNAYLSGHTTIGRHNEIHLGAVLGHEPQDLKFDRRRRTYLEIGDDNVFREYCTVHRGTEAESRTTVGNGCYLMGLCHVGHNCVVGNRVVICNCALVAGHAQVGDGAFVSGGVVIHQFTHVGRLAMFSGNARVSMDVPPFMLAAERNEIHAINIVGLKRAGLAEATIAELRRLFKLFYRSGLNTSEALRQAREDTSLKSPEAAELLEFIATSPNGICPPVRA